MFQGPVLASSRITGLGGSFAGIAEGVDGNAVNAAAPSLRVPWSVDWFDYDLTLGLTFPGSLRNTDFDNNGRPGFSYNNFLFATVGGNMQFGQWGVGLLLDTQTYHLEGVPSVAGAPPNLSASLQRGRLLLSRGFFDGQLHIGAGLRVANLDITASDNPQGGGNEVDLFKMTGSAPEVGLIWAPHALAIRAGVTGRAQVSSKADPTSKTVPNADGDTVIGTMFLPNKVELPWEIEAGVAVQLGSRKLNVPWVDPSEIVDPLVHEIERARNTKARRRQPDSKENRALHAEEDARLKASKRDIRDRLKARNEALPRHKWLLTSAVLISGPVRNAVGIQSFLQQTVDRSGLRVSVTPRVGIETEAIERLLQLRVGSYLEPTRFKEGTPRVHGTAGFDVRLFNWSVFKLFDQDTYWRAGGVVDLTRAYLGWGVSVGVWH